MLNILKLKTPVWSRIRLMLLGWGSVAFSYCLAAFIQHPGTLLHESMIDRLVPYNPAGVWFYLAFFIYIPVTYFIIEKERAEWLARSMLLSAIVAGIIFVIFPTILIYPPNTVVGINTKLLHLLLLDHSQNCLPSLHGALTLLCTWALIDKRHKWRSVVSIAFGLAIGYSIVELRRHLCIDVSAGILLGLLSGLVAKKHQKINNMFHILKWYAFTRYQSYRLNNNKKLAAWQHKKVKTIIKYAMQHSKFYQRFYSNYSSINWQHLPLLNKKILMANFNSLNTAGIDLTVAYNVAIQAENSRDFSPCIGNHTVGLSSGTSGNRGLFLVNDKERLAWAGTILAKMLPQHKLSKQRIAFFLRANSNIYTSLSSKMINFQFYDLLVELNVHIEKLNYFQPSILVAPPSMLRLLARAKKEKLLSINPIKIIAVAEVLEPLDKMFIEKEFQQMVHQIYQATEGLLAVTCQYGTLHLNEDIILVEKEYLNAEKTKFVPIITDLYRTSQPIIRYRLNDILSERKDPCPCKSIFTAIEQIDGRCDDLFYFPALETQHLKPIFPDFIRHAIIAGSDNIEEYMVFQHSHTKLQINLSCNSECADEIKLQIQANIHKLCQQLAVVKPEITFDSYVSPDPGIKLRRIIRNFKFEAI